MLGSRAAQRGHHSLALEGRSESDEGKGREVSGSGKTKDRRTGGKKAENDRDGNWSRGKPVPQDMAATTTVLPEASKGSHALLQEALLHLQPGSGVPPGPPHSGHCHYRVMSSTPGLGGQNQAPALTDPPWSARGWSASPQVRCTWSGGSVCSRHLAVQAPAQDHGERPPP